MNVHSLGGNEMTHADTYRLEKLRTYWKPTAFCSSSR